MIHLLLGGQHRAIPRLVAAHARAHLEPDEIRQFATPIARVVVVVVVVVVSVGEGVPRVHALASARLTRLVLIERVDGGGDAPHGETEGEKPQILGGAEKFKPRVAEVRGRRGERRQILRRETHAQVHSERATHRADEFARGFVRADGGELEGTLGADRPPRRRSPPRVRIAIVDFGHVHGKPGRRPARHGPLHVGLKQRRERASRPEHPAIEAHGLEVRLDARPARLWFVLERRPRHAIVRLVKSRKRATARPERFHGVFPLRVPRLLAAHERRGDYVRVVHVRRHHRQRARVARRIVANFEQRLYPRRVRLVKRLQVPRSARARRGEAFEDRLGGRAEFPRRLGAHTRVAPLLRRVLRGGVEGFETRRKRRASRTVHSRCRVQA